MSSKTSKGGKARMAALTTKERQALGRKAAKARWRSPRNTFGAALVEAEKKLAEAITQRQFHQTMYHQYNAEIPRLQHVVQALRAQQGQPQQPTMYAPQIAPTVLPADYSMETVMSEVAIPSAVPPAEPTQVFLMPSPPASLPPMAQPPRPPIPNRGGGGAVGQIQEEENENQFLEEADKATASGPRGGSWH